MRLPALRVISMIWLSIISVFFQTSLHASNLPDWVVTARIANAEPYLGIDEAELNTIVAQRKAENVSVIELDPGFSDYRSDAQFTDLVGLTKTFTQKAHANGMKVVTYIPALESNTIDGETLPNSMFKDHPDWVQRGFNGEPAVFYGSQEDWVDPGMESAWLSPDSGYRDYFIKRIKQMAASGIDGIWIDVPIYYGISNESWGGNESGAITEFKKWARANKLGAVSAPTKVDWDSENFRLWIRWRHENLAKFIEEVRQAALSINPDIVLIDEVFPVDNMDSSSTGLDKAWRVNKDQHISVWEVDSVSNREGMKWSNHEDFLNKITMYKFARGMDRENSTWGFSYGNEVLDASLVMSAAVATKVSPFEAKTPDMTKTVDAYFRRHWFGFIKDNEDALLRQNRDANVGIWYSSASRDYQDFKTGGAYGMYNTYVSPNNDPDWWGEEFGDTPFGKPHLGDYRGAAYALSKIHVPYQIVVAPGEPANMLEDLQFLWLPSVAAMSDEEAQVIKDFVARGGVVFASGTEPGIMDELGNLRNESILKDLFNLATGPQPKQRANINYGKGVAIYRPDILGKEFFPSDGGVQLASENLSDIDQIVRIHADDYFIVKPEKEGVHVEVSQTSATKHHLYVVNYSGLQLPIVSDPQNVDIQYHVPEGYEIESVRVTSPDDNATTGSVSSKRTAQDWYGFNIKVNQFSLVELTLRKAPQVAKPISPELKWLSAERKEAAESGLDFILNKMRHADKAAPYQYGVYTNLLNDHGLTEIYAHGHHVSAEHMGLTLRVAACMGNETAWQQSYEYIRDVMADPMYSVVNWAVDRDRDQPLVSMDDTWLNANAPLDDFRVIRGLLDGAAEFDVKDAEYLSQRLLTGLYRTTVTDRNHLDKLEFADYPEGLVGYAWDWEGTTDHSLTPAANASSLGRLTTDPIPVDYNDLFTMGEAAKRDPRWKAVLHSALDMLLASEVPAVPGLYFNGLQQDGTWTGDFENRDINQGQHLKMIQVLWIALHLANIADFSNDVIPADKRLLAKQAAQRSLAFFKDYYAKKQLIPEYLTFDGKEVAVCISENNPKGCLFPEEENLLNGEARIYAQAARLALLLDDKPFASQLISDKIMTDRISNPNDPRYGQIGVSTSSINDAEAWNVLESTLTLCLKAKAGGSLPPPPPVNQAPIAQSASVEVAKDVSQSITLQATDPEAKPLSYRITAQPQNGTLTGTGADRSYQPNAGFTGADSFSFIANDGELDSQLATISITVKGSGTNPDKGISNPVDLILLDGDLSDWSELASFGKDPDDISVDKAKLDWLEAWVAHDADSFYIAYRNQGAIDTAQWWLWETYLDTDSDAATGYQYSDQLGAEYVLQGAAVFRYAGTGSDWKWEFAGSLLNAVNNDVAELQLPKALIGNPETLKLAFFGNNFAYVGNHESVDFYPEFDQKPFLYKTKTTEPENQAPVASEQSVSTKANQMLEIVLSATDVEGDALTYQIVEQPKFGTLQGNLPNVTYQPNVDYIGKDSFSFQANDGKQSSNIATVNIAVTGDNPYMSNYLDTPILDGQLREWSAVTPFASDADDISGAENPIDLRTAWMANDETHFYLAYENDTAIPMENWWAWEIYFDADEDPTTGYTGYENIGADYVLQGTEFYQYVGTGAEGESWQSKWKLIGNALGALDGKIAELAVPRSWMNFSANNATRLMIYGDNGNLGGKGEDYYRGDKGYMQYQLQ